MKSEINNIPLFVITAESESFTQAALKLHLTRSAVAKAISRLEDRLQSTLFIRTTRKISLTKSGEIFYEHCRRAMNEINTAEDLLNDEKYTISGRLKVSMPVLFGSLFISLILTKLTFDNPNLILDLTFDDRIIHLYDENIDLAVRIGKIPDDAPYIARKVGSHKMVLCASPLYLKKFGYPEKILDLYTHKTIAYTHLGQIIKWRLNENKTTLTDFLPQSNILMNDMRSIVCATIDGAGISWVPNWLVSNELKEGSLYQILPFTCDEEWDIHVIWNQSSHQPIKIKIAVEKLCELLPIYLQEKMK